MSAFGILVTAIAAAVGVSALIYAAATVGREKRERNSRLARLRKEETARDGAALPKPSEETAAEAERRVRDLVGGFSVRDYAASEDVRSRVDAQLEDLRALRERETNREEAGRGPGPAKERGAVSAVQRSAANERVESQSSNAEAAEAASGGREEQAGDEGRSGGLIVSGRSMAAIGGAPRSYGGIPGDPTVHAYEPPEEFAQNANVTDPSIYDWGADDPQGFWAERARELHWFKEWDRVLDWDPPEARWFVGGKLNVAYNCLDYQVEQGRGDKTAILWESDEPGEGTSYTYAELTAEVKKFANVLKGLGVEKGDPVAIYMPMIPQLPIAMLACARIGAPHSVVFGAFSADSLRDRINDCEAKVLVTADGGPRGGKTTSHKKNADEALQDTPSIESVVVARRSGEDVPMTGGRDRWWDDLAAEADDECPAEEMDSEDVLFILYSSGSTGKPKGIVHTTGGYLTQVKTTTRWVLDVKDDDVYWCTADIGWITGHSYSVYGPLSVSATVLVFEGTPTYPGIDRYWDLIERHGVSVLYTAPTIVRASMKHGTGPLDRHDLSSLRLLGTVGEPINPRAWLWFYENVGGGRCPVVDTWWQTETGGIVMAPLPGITPAKPGSATLPFPGIDVGLYDGEGNELDGAGKGNLVIARPWPGMLRTIYKDPDRYRKTYWGRYGDRYLSGDGAERDEDGYYWVTGRVDDAMSVSGHHISAAEVEAALAGHEAVAEAAVIGRNDEDKGQAIVAYVILEGDREADEDLVRELNGQVRKAIGPHARPEEIIFAPDLPKTRSGKIMRRVLRGVAEGEEDLGDTSTLADPTVVDDLRASQE